MKKLVFVTIVFCLSTTVIADSTITMRTTYSDPASQGMKSTSIQRTKNQRQRVDDVMEMSGFKIVNIRLTMCDLKQVARIDPDAKIYTLRSLGPVEQATSDSVEGPNRPKLTANKAGQGKVVTKVKVVDKGLEKVAQLQAHHWIVDTDMTTSGCIGESQLKTHREFWTSNLPSFSCPILKGTWKEQVFNGGCKVSNQLIGDVDLYSKAMQHEVVKEIVYLNGKPQMTRELVDFSTAELDSSLFSIEGYRKVTEEQFQQAQSKKMMKMVTP